ncbi:MAG: WD40 repeat domain-containing protein [Cyanobacteria bacterium P01_A01_bin.45]
MLLKLKYWKIFPVFVFVLLTAAYKVRPSSTSAESLAKSDITQQQVDQIVLTLSGHDAPVEALSISPEGKILVSGSADNTVKVWNLHNGKLLRTLKDHKGRVTSVAIAPDGEILITGSDDSTIKIWNLKTGELISTLNQSEAVVTSIVITPDGKKFIGASTDKIIKVWNLKNQELEKTFKADTASLGISGDGKTLFSGNNDGTIHLFDFSSGKLLQILTPPLPKNPDFDFQKASAVSSIAVSNDGKTLVNSGYDDTHLSIQETDGKNIKVWNLQTGTLIHNFSVGIGSIDAVAISPDGKTFASGGYAYEISLWDVTTGKRLRTLSAKQGGVKALAFSKDGKILVSSSGNKSIKVWRLSH